MQNKLAEGFQFHKAGKLKKAILCYKAALKANPKHADALMLLGVALFENNKAFRAAQILSKAVSVAPDRADIQFNYGLALQELGRMIEARQVFEQALFLKADFLDAKYALAVVLVKMGLYEVARDHLKTLTEHAPDHAGVFGWLGVVSQELGVRSAAVGCYRKALTLDSENIEALVGLSSMSATEVRPQDALAYAEKAAQLAPDDVRALGICASHMEASHRLADAERWVQKCLKLGPKNSIAHLVKARLEVSQGRDEEARQRLEMILTWAHTNLEIKRDAYAILGSLLDKRGLYEEAFAAFMEKNKSILALPEVVRMDRQRVPEILKETRTWLQNINLSALPVDDKDQGPTPIFFVAFPRSGTTLMEMVLSAHPALQTSAELTAIGSLLDHFAAIVGEAIDYPQGLVRLREDQREALRKAYWASFEDELIAPANERILVDKNPYNILYLPMIRTLFPKAKVLVALRDPRDVCVSNFMQAFSANSAMLQMMDMESTARFYADVMGLWREMRDQIGLEWLEYRYEDFIDDFDTTVSKVLTFIGLQWDDAVYDYAEKAKDSLVSTPSYVAVTKKLNRKAIGRWKNYQNYMTSALKILQPELEAFGYTDIKMRRLDRPLTE